jgi:hypothetical protein
VSPLVSFCSYLNDTWRQCNTYADRGLQTCKHDFMGKALAVLISFGKVDFITTFAVNILTLLSPST